MTTNDPTQIARGIADKLREHRHSGGTVEGSWEIIAAALREYGEAEYIRGRQEEQKDEADNG